MIRAEPTAEVSRMKLRRPYADHERRKCAKRDEPRGKMARAILQGAFAAPHYGYGYGYPGYGYGYPGYRYGYGYPGYGYGYPAFRGLYGYYR